MAIVEREVFIQAPYAKVEQEATLSPSDWHSWLVGIKQVSPEPAYPIEGSLLLVQYEVAGISFEIAQTLLEFVPNRYTTFQLRGMINGFQTWSGKPEAHGTWVTVTLDYAPPRGGMNKILDRMMIERLNTRGLDDSLTNLKNLVEIKWLYANQAAI